MSYVLQAILVVLYLIVGAALSMPYNFLAGGNVENFTYTVVFAPIAAFFLLIVYMTRGTGRRDFKKPKWGGGFFWVAVAYFCSPILLNGASLLLKWAGYKTAGRYIFKSRYFSLLAVPMLLMFCCIVANGVTSIRQRFSGGATPPSSTPPSGFGPNRNAAISPSEDRKIELNTFQLASA